MQIAGNTQHEGRTNRGYAETWTSAQLDKLLAEDWLRKMVADIRGGDQKQKDRLPYICPHYGAFRNNHRAQVDIVPETFTFMTCVDVDDLAAVDKAVKRALELNSEEGGDWQDQVLRIAYSARKKVHIYIRMPVGKTIEETQRAFCDELEDVPYDESCTTPERFIYVTGRDEEIYRSDHWLQPLSDDELEERREAFLNRGLDVDGRPLRKDDGRAKKDDGQPSAIDPQTSAIEPQPSDARTLYIFDACMREAGLEPKHLVVEGARHDSLKSILSVGAAQLLTKDELTGVLQVRMPQNWQDENIRKLVGDFYDKYTDTSQKMTQFQRKVLAQSLKMTDGRELKDEGRGLRTDGQGLASTPPEMPRKLPKLIGLLTSNTPDSYKPAVAHAVFPALATHLCGVQFNYTDNTLHEATLMNCLMAETGAGKGCIDQPIKHIMADIRRRDAENERREKEWKDDCQKRGDNKDKRPRPEGLVIQIIDSDMTKPALVTRMDEAEGHFVYVKLNELDLFEQLKGQNGKQHFQLMCLAFDPEAEYGQTRVGTQSVTARPQCRFNWNACTTILKGRRFFRNVLTDGPISRINFCTIPEEEIGCDQPIFGQYDAAFDEALKPYIDNLVNARGLIDCPQAFRLAKKLMAECAETARLSQDRVYWNLSHRACVIAWLKACVLYVANGQRWEKTIEDFIRWSLNYDLFCKMVFFAADIDKANKGDDSRIGSRGPRNLLELLPDEFTIDDAKRVRQQQGMDAGNARKMISNWASREYVTQISEISFLKSEKFRRKK